MCRHSPSNDGGHQKSSFCQEKLNLIFNFFYPAIFSTFTKVLIMLFRPSFSSSAKSYETKRQLLSTTKSFCVQYESHFMKIKTISQNCFLRTFCYFAPKTSQGKMNLTCKMVVNDRLQNQFRIFFQQNQIIPFFSISRGFQSLETTCHMSKMPDILDTLL